MHFGIMKLILSFYIHGSVHLESNLIIVQQDAAVFSLLYFCRQLYMFRVLTPIIRSWYNCNYNFWCWSTGSTTILALVNRVYYHPGTGQPGLLPSWH